MEAAKTKERLNAFSCELEDWFHILDADCVPLIEEWHNLPLCAEENIDRLLELLAAHDAKGTFFCLGWMAEQMPHVVRRCHAAGHEIGSHGYGHVLAYDVGRHAFLHDVVRAKKTLEDLIGVEVNGFRAPGFSVRKDNSWVFDVVAEAGYRYDASVFPASHGHGGFRQANPAPHAIQTSNGRLVEIPTSTVRTLGRRVCLFGGGYLRLAPLPLIRWGVKQLHRDGRPLIVYIHPREVDPTHPRLPLPWKRRFKCYVNLHSTMGKLSWLCTHYKFTTMKSVADQVMHIGERRTVQAITSDQHAKPKMAVVTSPRRSIREEQVHSTG